MLLTVANSRLAGKTCHHLFHNPGQTGFFTVQVAEVNNLALNLLLHIQINKENCTFKAPASEECHCV